MPYNYWLFLTMIQLQKSATFALSILFLDIMQCFSCVNIHKNGLGILWVKSTVHPIENPNKKL